MKPRGKALPQAPVRKDGGASGVKALKSRNETETKTDSRPHS